MNARDGSVVQDMLPLVLVVDDEPVGREVTAYLLEASGLVVQLAADGLQALAMARVTRYGLVVMDMHLPHMTGDEAACAMRAKSLNRHTPILAMTASAFDDDRRRCLAAGMNAYLVKPIASAHLYQTVLAWLDHATATDHAH